MTIDWPAIGDFIKSVGIPTGLLLIILVPLVWAIYGMIKEWGPKVAQSHIDFLKTATDTQIKNSDTLAKLEQTIRLQASDHLNVNKAIRLGAQVGEAILNDKKDVARAKLIQINELLEEHDKGN